MLFETINAWEIRKRNFPNEIVLIKEIDTVSISVTGSYCALACAHCNSRYLKAMKEVDFLGSCDFDKHDSFLISGGCDDLGRVPVLKNLNKFLTLPDHVKINCHTGITTAKEAKLISTFADKVSFDFVSDDETVQKVYKLKRSYKDYIDSYINLSNHVDVAPHFCIGLTDPQNPDPSSEVNALDMLFELIESNRVAVPKEIVFIIFSPTKGTEMENCPPPDLLRVRSVLSYARKLFPKVNLHLGCMRPFGEYRAQVDKIAVDCGINLIVMPHRSLDAYLIEKGLFIIEENKCCVLANARSEKNNEIST